VCVCVCMCMYACVCACTNVRLCTCVRFSLYLSTYLSPVCVQGGRPLHVRSTVFGSVGVVPRVAVSAVGLAAHVAQEAVDIHGRLADLLIAWSRPMSVCGRPSPVQCARA
jgi:hypothetical protein